MDDVVTFPGRMYAFVNFQHAEDAARAQEALDGKEVTIQLLLPTLTACCLARQFGCQNRSVLLLATDCIVDSLLLTSMPVRLGLLPMQLVLQQWGMHCTLVKLSYALTGCCAFLYVL